MSALSLLILFTCVQDTGPVDGYRDWNGFKAAVRELGGHKNIRASSIGTTAEGRDLHLLTLGSDDNPAILIVGSVHAPHLLGSRLAMRIARRLAENEELLKRVTFYIIPRPSPDASERFFSKPFVENAANARETDDDRDAENGEDPFDDLNGDGWITVMRIEDESGTHMPHPDDPRVLIQADREKNEQPKYRILSEGRDNDEDEAFNEDGPGGVDLNRNFAFKYPFFKPGAGRHQVSEPESRALAEFCWDRTNIAAVFSFTPEDNLFETWKVSKDAERRRIKTTLMSDDAPYVKHISEAYRELHGGKNPPKPARGAGSFSAWAYWHYGRWSFAARGWWVPEVKEEKKEEAQGKEEEKKKKEKRGSDELNALKWFESQGIDGFVPWTKVEHPDFPDRTVEVGGIRPFLLLNPPATELDGLAERHGEFIEKLAGWLPRVSLEEAKVEDLGDGVFRVSAQVVNGGYLPTMSDMGRTTRKIYPLWARIGLPEGAKLITGNLKRSLPPIGGNGEKEEVSWVVIAPEGGRVTLGLWGPSIGTDEAALELR